MCLLIGAIVYEVGLTTVPSKCLRTVLQTSAGNIRASDNMFRLLLQWLRSGLEVNDVYNRISVNGWLCSLK